MNDDNFLGTLAASLNQNASVKNVFGEPVRAGEKVIIPVAQVMLGMGGGHGHSNAQNKKLLPTNPPQTASPERSETPAEGAGGGGVMRVVAKGVYEITPKKTRFIPVYGANRLIISLVAAFVLGQVIVFRLTRKQH